MNSIAYLLICFLSFEIVKCNINPNIEIDKFDKARLQSSSQRSDRDDLQQHTNVGVNQLMCITCEARLEELQKNLTNVLNAYSNLCNEMRRINGQLSLHEQAIENIAVNSLHKSSHHQSKMYECIGSACSDRQRERQNAPDIHSQIHKTGDHVHVSESQSHSHRTSRRYIQETRVLRDQRVVNNGTHTIYYSTTQTEENGVMSKPETNVRVFLNSPDQQIYQNQEKIGTYDSHKRQRRDSESTDIPEVATKTVIDEDNIELISSQRPKYISPEEFKDTSTDMPWEVEAGKPIPFQRTPKQSVHFNEKPNERSCGLPQANCMSSSYECNQYSASQRKSAIFQNKYKKWVRSLIGNQSTGSNFILNGNNNQNEEKSAPNRQNDQLSAESKKLDETKADQFDRTVTDAVYATCSMVANRHIPLILQEDIEGTINMWQNRFGGPVFMHVKLKGLKTRLSDSLRFRRESNIFEVRVPYNASNDNKQRCMRAFHVHEFGNLTKGCQYTGTHYNPKRLLHGGPSHIIRHVGDLGNLVCHQNGTVDMQLEFQKVSLTGEYSIIGRSIVIHSHEDDFGKNPSEPGSASNGNSGPKIACCVIERVDRLPQLKDQ